MPPAALPGIAQPGQAVKGKPPQAAGVPPLDGPLPAVRKKYLATGDISPQSPSQARGTHLWTKCPEAGARLLFELVLFLRLCQLRGLFLFPLVQQSHNLFFHFGRSDLLAEIL